MRLRDNFRHNKKHYEEGVHYFKLEGEALNELKESENYRSQATQSSPIANATRALMLWTKQGVARHCQSLKRQGAWEIFAELERDYFQSEEPPAVAPSNEPQLFTHPQFGNLRVVFINGEIWFVGKDVAESLGYKNTTEAIRYHVDERDKRGENILLPSGVQSTILINKSGLNSLILDSQMPLAKEYRHWVTSEVLVQVDEKGYYCPQGSLFPVEEATSAPVNETERNELRLKKQLASIEKFEFAVVYILLMGNGTVKIGYTDNLTRRIKEIKAATKLDVLNYKTTAYMSKDDAIALETSLKEKYAADCLGGEYFDVRFVDLCKDL